jgi:hypothetical protein
MSVQKFLRFECYDVGPYLPFLSLSLPMSTKTKVLIALAILAIFDAVIPVPIAALVVIYAILQKPPWATDLVRDIYGTRMGESE